ncbi:MAG: bifunctional metallophosphatase/5'-nucleotidase [Clostridia bacterium]|nr:bifunctional metallophosphatase/5'-nucleotidase [Clostridia bacterium]
MSRYKKLTLLHSNDMHGDFLAQNVDEKLVGGVSMLSGYVSKVRNEEKNTLYCIAGDMFRGSVIDSEFKGVSTIEIMNMLSPDVVTVGNHETDYGIAHLLFIEKCAKFPIINANLHIKTNGSRLFKPHHIFELDGMKILFIGIITESVMKQARNEGLIGSFLDVYEAAQGVGRICNAYTTTDVDLTVLLTHIGFEEDKQLAEQLDPACGVDIIVGGHSHTFIDEPAVVNGIPVVQAGVGTDGIGRFDITVDTKNNCIYDYKWQFLPIVPENCPRDEEIDEILTSYKTVTDVKYSRVISRFKRKLTHPDRFRETELGDLFCDILAERLGVDVMLLASGSIRGEELGPVVQYRNLTECFPYDGKVNMLTVTGRQLHSMLKFMLRDEVWQGGGSGFFQLSKRLRVYYDVPEGRIISLTFDGKPVEDDALYRIGLQQFQYSSFEKYFDLPIHEIEDKYPTKTIATSVRDIIEEYLSDGQNIDAVLDGRITITGKK